MVSKIKFTYFTADARVLSFRSAIIQLCSCFGLATVLKTKYMGKTSDGTGTGSSIIHEFIYLSNHNHKTKAATELYDGGSER